MSQFTEIINETGIIIENKIIGIIDGDKRDLGSGQDRVFFGQEENYSWGVLLDGHGAKENNYFLSIIARQDWESIMKEQSPGLALIESIKKENREISFSSYTSGATMSMMKIFADRIETTNIGDSRTAIYKNGELIYVNTPHNRKNPLEVRRLAKKHMRYIPSTHKTPYMVSSKLMRFKQTEYCIFEDNTRLAMSQSLGHNHITGYEPECHTEYFNESDKMRVVCGSDGFFDMILLEDGENEEDNKQDLLDITNMGVQAILDKVEARWKQKWILDNGSSSGYVSAIFEPDMYDDISTILWHNSL